MQQWQRRLQRVGEVATFDYPYMQEGKRRPDPLPRLISAHRAALADFQKKRPGEMFLVGKSMGGRIGCHVALEEKVTGVICFGYPLCAAGDRGKLRDKVLRELAVPILFIQGTRDALCPLDLLAGVRRDMTAPSLLEVVEGGDHSLLVTKTLLREREETQEEVDERILGAVKKFMSSLTR